ncbi:MAG: rRNA maturation RNase YbeY [Myxococcales bacterium]|nr:rRNA maturation RNase YbeY [Myxococcales bacterium]
MSAAPQVMALSSLPPWVRGELCRELACRLRRAGRRLGIADASLASAAIHIVDDPTIARLNREHMGKRGPTDVLSFPSAAPGFIADFGVDADAEDAEDEGEGAAPPAPALGDVVIAWPAIVRQAAGFDAQALVAEATVLAIHGLAHLLGHDHAERSEGRAMHRVELRALAAAGVADIPRPYGLRPSGAR